MSAEFLASGPHTIDAITRLSNGQTLHGAVYNNIIVSSSEPDIIDDPNVSSMGRCATLYWPGGSPDNQAYLETTTTGEAPASRLEAMADTAKIRNAILGGYIGEAAIKRIPTDFLKAWQQIKASNPDQMAQLKQVCESHKLPLAVCFTSDVTRGAPDNTPGARIMHMFYPNTSHPVPILKELQAAVRSAIKQEQI
ncbi:MAG TPA: hypothetical protein VF733_01970 [Candidatus Saccharimonadales bacterium]